MSVDGMPIKWYYKLTNSYRFEIIKITATLPAHLHGVLR
jgi:hypothetical protein